MVGVTLESADIVSAPYPIRRAERLLSSGSSSTWEGLLVLSLPSARLTARRSVVLWPRPLIGVGSYTYVVPILTAVAFIAIMIVGAIIALCLAPPWLVVRSDGSRAGHNPKLAEERNETFRQKFVRIVKREFFSVLAIRHEKR
jgi:hypothetical protein